MFNTSAIGTQQLKASNRAMNAASYFQGTHFEMGREQGRLFKPVIHWCLDLMRHHDALLAHKPWFLPTGLFFKFASAKSERELFPHLRSYLKEQLERLEGIAVGADAPVGQLALLQMAEIMFNKVDYFQGCSAFGVRGAKSPTGKPILAKNFDYPPEFGPAYIFRYNQPDNRLRSLDFGGAVIAGNHDGMNEEGLTILYNYGHVTEDGQSLVPITMLVQEALETCKTVREAVTYFQKSPRAGGALLMLADPSGDMVALEMAPSRVVVREAEGDVLMHTNHYQTEDLKQIQVPLEATYGYKAPKALIGESVFSSSLKRFDSLESNVKAHSVIGVEEAKAIMSDTGDGAPDDNSLCRQGDYYATCNSVVADVGNKTVHACGGRPDLNPYVPYTF